MTTHGQLTRRGQGPCALEDAYAARICGLEAGSADQARELNLPAAQRRSKTANTPWSYRGGGGGDYSIRVNDASRKVATERRCRAAEWQAGDSLRTLLDRADAAMYRDKRRIPR